MSGQLRIDDKVSRIAAAIGEPARARMLFSLADGRGRTSTELAVIAGVTPSTASVHLKRLNGQRLVTMVAQGKHRYYSLSGADVAAALEALDVVAGHPERFMPPAPESLRAARSCYDHIAGALGVALHDRLIALEWLTPGYDVLPTGVRRFASIGIDVDSARAQRRKFAFACLDWSERRPHLAGALGAAVLRTALDRNWVRRELDSRALVITAHGRREFAARFQLAV